MERKNEWARERERERKREREQERGKGRDEEKAEGGYCGLTGVTSMVRLNEPILITLDTEKLNLLANELQIVSKNPCLPA